MATETFDKFFYITDPKAVKKILEIVDSEPIEYNQSDEDLFAQKEIQKSEKLLKQCLSRLKN